MLNLIRRFIYVLTMFAIAGSIWSFETGNKESGLLSALIALPIIATGLALQFATYKNYWQSRFFLAFLLQLVSLTGVFAKTHFGWDFWTYAIVVIVLVFSVRLSFWSEPAFIQSR